MEQHTAKHFALQLGSLASLYLSLSFFIVLVFGFVDLLFIDELDSYWDINNYSSMIRVGFAATVVFFPTYLWLTRTVNKNRRQSETGTYLGLTKWLIYLSLLVGGAVLLTDLVMIIISFLEGELTNRFLVKAVAVLVITGTAFWYYTKDAQGYWLTHEKQSKLCGYIAAAIITTTSVAALFTIDTPQEARDKRFDQQQLVDLQNIQWSIQSYLEQNQALPEKLADAMSPSETIPTAPSGRADYRYIVTEQGFDLCATFMFESREENYSGRPYPTAMRDGEPVPTITNPDNWYYEAGEWCFEREVRF